MKTIPMVYGKTYTLTLKDGGAVVLATYISAGYFQGSGGQKYYMDEIEDINE